MECGSWLNAAAIDAGLRNPPTARGDHGHAGRGADRVHAVSLCRRSRAPDGGPGHVARGPPGSAQGPRPGRPDPGPVCPLRRQRGALRIRHFLPGEATGHPAHRRTPAGNHGTRFRSRPVCRGVRHSDGRLYRHPPRQLAVQGISHRIAHRHLAADLPDRHPADLHFRGVAQRAAVVRPRRYGGAGLLAHRACSPLPASRLSFCRPSRWACSR